MSIRANIVITTVMLSSTVFLFLSVYGYSQVREASSREEEAVNNLMYSINNRLSEFGNEHRLKEYIETLRLKAEIFLVNSEGIYLTDKPGTIPDTFNIKRLLIEESGDTAVSIHEETQTMLKLIGLEKPFKGLYIGATYVWSPIEQQKLRNMTILLLIIGSFFLAFAAVISYYVASDTSMSIKDIEKRMRKISEEKETMYKGFEVTSLDEVGDLTRGFNNLQAVIHTKYQELDAANKKLFEMERRQAKKALEKSEERYRLLAENVTDVIWTLDIKSMRYSYVSPSVMRLLGYTAEETINLAPEQILTPSSFEIATKALEEEMAIEKMERKDMSRARALEFEHIHKDGSTVWAEVRMTFLRDPETRPVGILGVTRDITERKKLEDQLRHSQKMEAVGTLTRGIAHDFNNILTTIINCGNILQIKMDKDEPLRTHVSQILASSERAANLIQSLLSFSRKYIIRLKPVNPNEIVERVEKLLSRIIGEEIELRIKLTDEDLFVMADPGQIEQVLINLCTNAKDALPEGGLLTISTELVELDNGFIKAHGYGKPGLYALISAADSGTGMDEKTQERIFEPFFTTKEVGKGTGLGLSIVYGIVKQHNGFVTVYSEPGRGTTFKIYLPLTKSRGEGTKSTTFNVLIYGSETVLVAEDDSEVREISRDILEEFGYTVIEAVDGEDAIEKFTENKDGIELILLDVIMPKKNGKDVYDEIKKIRPGIRALFTSGYTADIINKKGLLEEGINFISKPVSPTELLKKVREVLDR